MPVRWRRPIPNSLIGRVIDTGRTEYDEGGRFAVVTRPIVWKGRLTKVTVISVRCPHRTVLDPPKLSPGFSNPIKGLAASASSS